MNSMIRFKNFLTHNNIFKIKYTTSAFSNIFKDKEKIEEKIFIDKQEREVVKKLLEKLHANEQKEQSSTSTSSSTYSSAQSDSDAENLRYILDSRNTEISKELFNDLLKWKKGQFN